MNIPIWGISKWRDFEQCPAMYYAKNVTKEWKDFPNDAMNRGRQVHKSLEDAVKYELQLPEELARFNAFVGNVIEARNGGATVVPEHKFGMSIDYQRTPFFEGNNLRVRLALDLYIEKDRHVVIIDYKTGKHKTEHEEDAEFYGAATHMTHGALTTEVQYLYVDHPECSFSKHIEDSALIMSNWWKKFEYADKLIAGGNPPRTPCNACSWCGAFKCPNNKNRKLGN